MSPDSAEDSQTLVVAVASEFIGLVALLFGPYLASKYGITELSDSPDHLVYLIIGLFASFAWWRRKDL